MTSGVLDIAVEPDLKGFDRKLGKGVEDAGRSAEKSGESAGHGVGLAFIAGLGAATAAIAGIKRGLDISAQLEQNQVALEGLLGSGQQATQFLGELSDFAKATPFQLPGLVDSAQQLLGVGVAAADVIPTLQAFGDVTAAFGGSQEDLNGVLLAVTQSLAKGRFQGEELLQIQERGIPITRILGDAMGITAAQVLKLAEAGELTATEVLPVLREQLNKEYGGSLAAQAGTLTGVLSNFKDTVDIALGSAVEPLAEALIVLLPQAAEIAANGISLFGVGLKAAVLVAEPILSVILDLAEAFTSLPEPVQLAVLAFVALRGGPISAIRSLIGGAQLLAANFQTASAGAVGLTGNLKAAGAAAKTTAVSVGVGGLTGALKGLAGAAVLGVLIDQLIKIGNQSRNAQENVNALLGGLNASDPSAVTASLADLNKELAANQQYLDDKHGISGFQELFTSADNNIDALTAGIDELNIAQEHYQQNLADLASQLGITETAAAALAAQQGIDLVGWLPDADGLVPLGRVAGLAEDAAAGLERLVDAQGQSGAQQAFAESLAVINDELATGEERANALVDALAALNGDPISVLEAEANVQDSLAGVAEALGAVDEAGNAVGLSAVSAAGALDLTSEAGRAVQSNVLGAAESARQAAEAAYELAISNGDVAGASEAAGAAAQAVRDDFIAQALAAHLTIEQATALANTYGLIPGEVVTAIATPGMTEAQIDLIDVATRLQDLAPGTEVPITALTDEAERLLLGLGITVTTLPDGEVVATARTQEAQDALDRLTNPRYVNLYVNTINRTSGAYSLNPGQAMGSILGPGGVQLMAGGGWYNGHRLSNMPAGIAAMVPPNSWKTVVGDRSRDMEAYIPVNQSRRSLQLLEETARRMGWTLTRAMADGGFFGSAPTASAAATRTALGGRTEITGSVRIDPDNGLLHFVEAVIKTTDADKKVNARAWQRERG